MALFIDDYTILDTEYLVHACMINPDLDDPPGMPYLLGIVLHVGSHAHPCAIEYPSRMRRDAAFEELVALMRKDTSEMEEDVEEGE